MQLTSSLSGRANGSGSDGGPLVIAVHGGTYTSAYFDLPGRSLLDSAAANGIAVVAIDRPGYVNSPMLAPDSMDIAGQAAFLRDALGEVWEAFGGGRSGVVLIGHSIGAAIAATIAASVPDWPLLGLAISGVGLTTNPGDHERWQGLPDIPLVAMPDEVKDHVMFGPEGSYDADMPEASHAANTTAPKAELLAITGAWHNVARDVLGRIAVPVHYRQAEFDRLWIIDQGEVDKFAVALGSSPLVDARLVQGSGHCIDFHRIGPAFQLQQLGFALECAVR
ncbi:MAG TPA: alpha/beta hydrolase [Novosphingobium sp.]|nr:alpha/beta hydrolase [Novosphingobium sp.]